MWDFEDMECQKNPFWMLWLLPVIRSGSFKIRDVRYMECCGQILWDSFETYETFPGCIITE